MGECVATIVTGEHQTMEPVNLHPSIRQSVNWLSFAIATVTDCVASPDAARAGVVLPSWLPRSLLYGTLESTVCTLHIVDHYIAAREHVYSHCRALPCHATAISVMSPIVASSVASRRVLLVLGSDSRECPCLPLLPPSYIHLTPRSPLLKVLSWL